ncbi:MAG: acyltransferase [Planctomycetales bacterium]|nr:acyltransferase [Planctomycetales bacterium]MBN8624217.1 acyltransferase [Planctomycetota bacterium]
MRPQLPALTGLRFIAALLVMYAHSICYYLPELRGTGSPLYDSFVVAHVGMTLFFVLSGFVIHYNYGPKVVAGRLREFFCARVARLYPLYLLFLAAAVIRKPAAGEGYWQLAPAYLTLTQNWWPVAGADIYFAAAWSISTELGLYLLYVPAAVALVRLRSEATCRTVIAVYVAAASALFAGLYAAGLFDGWWVYKSPYARVAEFGLGALLAQYFVVTKGDISQAAARRWSLVGVGLLTGAAAFVVAGSSTRQTLGYCWTYAPGAAALIVAVWNARSFAARTLGSRPLVLLGEASYSLYFLHTGVFHLFAPTSGSGLVTLSKIAASWLIACASSIVLYHVYEVPLRNLIRRRREPGAWSRELRAKNREILSGSTFQAPSSSL